MKIFYISIYLLTLFTIKCNGLPKTTRKIPNNEYENENLFNEQRYKDSREYLNKILYLDNYNEIAIDQYNLMLKYMDRNADPCNDFHQYACGNWKKYHKIPDDVAAYNVFAILNDNLQSSLQHILTTKIKNNHDSVHNDNFNMEEQISIFYSSCSDIDLVNKRGTKPLFQLIEKLGGFPLLDGNKWSKENYHLEEVLAFQSIYGFQSFFFTSIEYDIKDVESSVIYVQHPELGLSSNADYLVNYNVGHLNGYRNFIAEVLEILNAPRNKISSVVNEIINLEKKLAKYTDTRTISYEINQLYDPQTIGILKEKYPAFDWVKYFRKIFDKEFSDDRKIVIFGTPKTDKIYDLLVNTDKRIIANYLIWRVIQQMLDYLDERFREPYDKLRKIITGSGKNEKGRNFLCATEVNNFIGLAVSSLYVKEYFTESFKQDVSKMTEELTKVFRDNLYSYAWIDDETKLLAELKVNKTRLAVGYPDFILNKTELNQYYQGIHFKRGKYFENILNFREYESIKQKEKLYKKVDKDEWPTRPTVINAFFEQAKNRIIMPAAILQPPIYHGNFPKFLNYGAIGVFIGHELTHGFDTVGREFDQYGNMNSWWTSKSFERFEDRAQCFIDQYGNFEMHNKTLSGDITKEENIADNGGLRLAFKVYSNWLKTANEKERRIESIPGFNLTPQQLFFIAFAQSWCEYIRPEAIENQFETDSHPPGKFRIIGALQNFKKFSKAYQCSKNSVMNPSKKCILW